MFRLAYISSASFFDFGDSLDIYFGNSNGCVFTQDQCNFMHLHVSLNFHIIIQVISFQSVGKNVTSCGKTFSLMIHTPHFHFVGFC